MSHGHTVDTITSLPPEVKQDLIFLHAHGQIGWRAGALNAYMVCMFLRSLENTVRMVNGAKRHQLVDMPEFEKLFFPDMYSAAKTVEDQFQDFFDQVDRMHHG